MSSNYNHLRTRSSRDHFMEPPSVLSRILSVLPTRLAVLALRTLDKPRGAIARLPSRLRNAQRAAWRPTLRSFVNVPNAFIAIWFLLLLWGERWAFHSAIKQCRWENWERWVGSYSATWSWMNANCWIASSCDATSPCSPRGSATCGPAHIYRAAVAAVDIYGAAYG